MLTWDYIQCKKPSQLFCTASVVGGWGLLVGMCAQRCNDHTIFLVMWCHMIYTVCKHLFMMSWKENNSWRMEITFCPPSHIPHTPTHIMHIYTHPHTYTHTYTHTHTQHTQHTYNTQHTHNTHTHTHTHTRTHSHTHTPSLSFRFTGNWFSTLSLISLNSGEARIFWRILHSTEVQPQLFNFTVHSNDAKSISFLKMLRRKTENLVSGGLESGEV